MPGGGFTFNKYTGKSELRDCGPASIGVTPCKSASQQVSKPARHIYHKRQLPRIGCCLNISPSVKAQTLLV